MEDQHFVPNSFNHAEPATERKPKSVAAWPIRKPFEAPPCEPVDMGYTDMMPMAEGSKPQQSKPGSGSDGKNWTGH